MKMAIIGFGGMGNNHRQYIVRRLNDSDYPEKIDLVGVYDIDPARKAYAESLGLKAFESDDEIWNDPEIKIVLVSVPNDMHLPYVEKAAKAGKNIIVEKPASMGLGEVEKMYDVTEKAGVVFTPHQNRRWDDDFLSVKAVADEGKLGRVYRIESRVMGSNGIPGAWRKEAKRGGGMMLDWGVHLIDQMLCWIDSTVTSVYCTYSYEAGEDVDDGFDLEVKFENGIVYRIVVDTNTFIVLPRWQVYGTDGTATVTEWRKFETVEGEVVRCVQRFDDKLEGVNAGNGFTKTMAARREETEEKTVLPHVYGDKNEFYANLMDAIRLGKPLIVTREQEERLFRVMEAAKRSAEKGEVIRERI